MRTTLWVTVALLLITIAVLVVYLLKSKNDFSVFSSLGIADLTAVISLALNAALFLLTILSLVIAVAAFKASEKSGDEQLETLKRSREALQVTADTLKGSAQDFRDSAQATKGQYAFLLTEKQERDQAVLSSLQKELASNEAAIAENQKALETELQFLKEGKSLIGPINSLQTGTWELLRLYLPPEVSTKEPVLASVTGIYKLTHRINEIVRSREDYRNTNGAMSNFNARMTGYDQQLQELNVRALAELKTLLSIIGPLTEDARRRAKNNPKEFQ